ncbi:hypothetical protein FIBSPDRAFT_933616 [Athelia psychrophila]|uniref:Vacuolar sorting protein 39/Transforming growth factor beta receptor-associated domain-containing protein n=1 Tax=Athelia psychrophila TaxID=1759441 RepID=A0A166GTS6_9AGAM|nr:hypothetical protein FIBSPDRAFT_933616 [Fibularhizoctonia sp. CBS 109695]
MKLSKFPRSSIVVLGPNSVEALLPSTLLSQAESLLDAHRIPDAVGLVDQQRKKIEAKLEVDDDEADELRYVYQRLGFQCLGETLFEEAGNHLFAGDLDPRALVSYYPELCGSLFSATDELDIFSGVVDHMPHEPSVYDIIVANIVRNYSPHMSPNTREAPITAELRKVLGIAAREMLEKYLRRWRRKRVVDGGPGGGIDEVVDTVLAKLFCEDEKTNDLYTLIREPNHIKLPELEPTLIRTGQYSALCTLCKERGEDTKLLNAWSKLVDGEWSDTDIKDPLSDIITFVTEKRDKKLTQQWGIWLTKRDPVRAMKLLTSRDTSKRRDKPEDDLAMLQQVREADPAAGAQYLEHLVLQKRSQNPDLHAQLALSCIDQLLACLSEEGTSKLWRAKASSYSSTRADNRITTSSFLSYFSNTTPDSEHKRVRLKTLLFLQGSALYDPTTALSRLKTSGQEKVLGLELAVLYGKAHLKYCEHKLADHPAALSILVHDLRDATSAEAYCTLGGEVIPARVAQTIGEKCGLEVWAAALFPIPTKGAPMAITRQKTVDEGVKKGLLKVLLEVYMKDEYASISIYQGRLYPDVCDPRESERTTQLLNAQAMNLDVADVLPLVPPDWSLSVMSTFLTRSFRRTLHAQHEGQIVKAISSGQNLQVADDAWMDLREQGAMIEEGDGDDADGDGNFDEKDAMLEKVGLHLSELGEDVRVADVVHVPGVSEDGLSDHGGLM